MGLASFLVAVVTATQFFLLSTLAVDLNSSANLVAYWGQGPNQKRLSHFCQDDTIDVIVIGFINVFPEQGAGGYPGSNFGNQCWDTYYENEDGVQTELLKDCPQIVEDIPICQAAGKTILLSLGGATDRYRIETATAAIDFADFLWGAFGPVTPEWEGKPRPFRDSVVDGFDLDIEHNGDYGYSVLAARLRWNFEQDPTRKYYLSAAPQCQIPDVNLGSAIQSSWFDFIFVQFYNTPSCSARAWISDPLSSGFTLDGWVDIVKNSPNPAAKVFIGLPASESAAGWPGSPKFYLEPIEVGFLLSWFAYEYPDSLGGIMLWEATYSEDNQIDGRSYAHHVKELLLPYAPPKPSTTTTISATMLLSLTTSSSAEPTTSSVFRSSSAPMSSNTLSSSSVPTTSSTEDILSTTTEEDVSSTSETSSWSPTSSSTSAPGATTTSEATSVSSSSSVNVSPSTTQQASTTSTPCTSDESIAPAIPSISSASSVDLSTPPTPIAPITSSPSTTSSIPLGSSTSVTATAPAVTTTQEALSSATIPSAPGTSDTLGAPTGSSSPSASRTTSVPDLPSASTTLSSVNLVSSVQSSWGSTGGLSESITSSESRSTWTTDSSTLSPNIPSASYSQTLTTTAVQSFEQATSSLYTRVTSTSSTVEPSLHSTSTRINTPSISTSSTIPGAPTLTPTSKSRVVSNTWNGTGGIRLPKPTESPIYGHVKATEPTSTVYVPVTTITAGPTNSLSTTLQKIITTVIVTSYTTICPTGYSTVTYSYTATYCPVCPTPTSTPGALPEGWTTTVIICPTQCAPTPTTVTLTVPIEAIPATTTVEVGAISVPERPIQISSPSTSTTTLTLVPSNSALPPSDYDGYENEETDATSNVPPLPTSPPTFTGSAAGMSMSKKEMMILMLGLLFSFYAS